MRSAVPGECLESMYTATARLFESWDRRLGESSDTEKPPHALGARCLVIALWLAACGSASAEKAAPLESGLKKGERPDTFDVQDCTGPAAGKRLCYFCRYGLRPVCGIFVRELDGDVAELIGQVDRTVREHRDKRLAAFVVYLGRNTSDAEAALKDLAAEQNVRSTPLTILAGKYEDLKASYRLADEAAITVITWRRGIALDNFASGDTELSEAEMQQIAAAVQDLAEK